MKKKIIKSLIIEAFNFYGLDGTCDKVVSARNFVRYSGEIKKVKKSFSSYFVEKYISIGTQTDVFLKEINCKDETYFIDISKPVFKALPFDEAISKGKLGWNLPILLGEKEDGAIVTTALENAKHILFEPVSQEES